MTVDIIFNHLCELYPLSTACDFDNPGLLVGDSNSIVTKAIIALDCSPAVADAAIDSGCQLIITHHPVIFNGLKSVTESSLVYRLIKNGISVISMHTNLDVGDGGVNDCLCAALGLKHVEKVAADDGFLLRKGSIDPISADSFAEVIKKKLGGTVKYVAANREIKNVLVCSGSGCGYLGEVKRLGCDALITAEVKHNVFIDAQLLDISLFDAGHFNTEDVVTEPLRCMLQNKFCDVEFIASHISGIQSI